MAQDATIHQDSDYTLEFTIYTTAAETTARDLTGYGTPVYRVGSLLEDGTDLQINGQISDAVNGKIQVSISSAQSGALPVDTYDHQLFVTDNSSNTQVALDGKLVVKEALPSV